MWQAIFDAAVAFEHRLPELFAGSERDQTDPPCPTPDGLAPQAWAAAAPLLALRVLLGLEIADGRLRSAARVPRGLGSNSLSKLRARGRVAHT